MTTIVSVESIQKDLFTKVAKVLKYSGVRVVKSNSLLYTYFSRIYSFIIVCLMCIYTVVSITVSAKVYNLNTSRSEEFTLNMWFVISTVLFSFLWYWQVKDKFCVHLELLEQATSLAGYAKYRKRLMVVSNMCFSIIFLSILFFCGQTFYVTIFTTRNVEPFTVGNYLFVQPYGKFLYCFMFYYMALACTVTMYIFAMTCIIDTVELCYLNGQLKGEQQITVEKLKPYFSKHTKLITAVDQLDETFRVFIFALMCGTLPIIIIFIYKLITDPQSFNLQLLPWLFGQCFTVTVFTISPAALNWAVSMSEIVVAFSVFILFVGFGNGRHRVSKNTFF